VLGRQSSGRAHVAFGPAVITRRLDVSESLRAFVQAASAGRGSCTVSSAVAVAGEQSLHRRIHKYLKRFDANGDSEWVRVVGLHERMTDDE
jgi:hypothetical protein